MKLANKQIEYNNTQNRDFIDKDIEEIKENEKDFVKYKKYEKELKNQKSDQNEFFTISKKVGSAMASLENSSLEKEVKFKTFEEL